MLIAAIATRLKEHCDNLDIPFLFHPMPDTLISTFQGGSAEKMVEWMKPMQDPSKLIFAPIDDAENNLQERTAQGVSAGVKEVIGVFLRYTEGAYAVNYGNSSIGLFTNLPEMLDKAVISRVQGRFKIDGARTEHDFLDQDHLWWRKLDKTMPDFVNMKSPSDYEYLKDQGLAKNMGDILNSIEKPSEARVLDAYSKAEQLHSTDNHLFFASLYKEIQNIFPFFSSNKCYFQISATLVVNFLVFLSRKKVQVVCHYRLSSIFQSGMTAFIASNFLPHFSSARKGK